MNISETCISPSGNDDADYGVADSFRHFRLPFAGSCRIAGSGFFYHSDHRHAAGASPETMGASVAGPIERQLSTKAGVTSITST